jgi:hypothetical protein
MQTTIPRCSRCNIESYGGEVKITVTGTDTEEITEKVYSLCGYCLPIVAAKLQFTIEPYLLIHKADPQDEILMGRLIISKE